MIGAAKARELTKTARMPKASTQVTGVVENMIVDAARTGRNQIDVYPDALNLRDEHLTFITLRQQIISLCEPLGYIVDTNSHNGAVRILW